MDLTATELIGHRDAGRRDPPTSDRLHRTERASSERPERSRSTQAESSRRRDRTAAANDDRSRRRFDDHIDGERSPATQTTTERNQATTTATEETGEAEAGDLALLAASLILVDEAPPPMIGLVQVATDDEVELLQLPLVAPMETATSDAEVNTPVTADVAAPLFSPNSKSDTAATIVADGGLVAEEVVPTDVRGAPRTPASATGHHPSDPVATATAFDATAVDQDQGHAEADTDGGEHDHSRSGQRMAASTAGADWSQTANEDGTETDAPLTTRPTAATSPNAIDPASVRETAEARGGSPADRAVASQVTRAILTQTSGGGRTLTIRLTPPELGTVRIQVIEQGGQLQVRMSAEDDAVRSALERALPTMRQDLRTANAPVADVQLDDQHPGLLQQDQDHAGTENGSARRDGGQRPGTGEPAFSLEGEDTAETVRSVDPGLHATIGADAIDARA